MEKVCPRCGERYSYIERRRVGRNVYLYAVHYWRDESGRRRVRKCYLGPLTYEYVSHLHDFTLRGLSVKERNLQYLETLLHLVAGQVQRREVPLSEVRNLLRIVQDFLKICRDTALLSAGVP